MDMLGFIDYCAEQGLEGAELTSYYLPDPPPKPLLHQLKRRAHLQGVEISGGAIGNNFAHADADHFAQQWSYTRRWLEAYAQLGAPVIRVFAGRPPAEQNPAECEQLVIDRLGQACELAGKYGILLGIENHDFTTDIDRLERILKAVDSPWFGANLDTGNISNEVDPYAALERIAPYAVNVQVKTLIPVDGQATAVNYDRVISILLAKKYLGYVVLEYEEANPRTEIPQHLQQLRNALRQSPTAAHD